MTKQDLQFQEKQEQEKAEKTELGRYFVPQTDIHESANALTIDMDMPGVRKENVDIRVEKDVLTITGSIDSSTYDALTPIYTEYNVGNYTRSFTLSSKIDQGAISARMEDGVLKLHLPKIKEAGARRIDIK